MTTSSAGFYLLGVSSRAGPWRYSAMWVNILVVVTESLTVSDTSPRLTASTSRTTSVNYVFEATFRFWQSWVIVGGPVRFAKNVRSVAFT